MENAIMYRILTGLVLCMLISGCGVLKGYKPTIEQGNIYTEANIERLNTGMSKAQCAYILGNSILEPVYKSNRWEYVYTLKPRGNDKTYKKYLILYFDGDMLTRVESSQSKIPEPHL